MSPVHDLRVGQRVDHPQFGDGVVIALEASGFVQVFFRELGERRVPAEGLSGALGWSDRVLAGLSPASPGRLERLWLATEAAELPLMDGAATLTAAKVALLPHQVVLVHRIASVPRRRYLIADEVGLGKTIETALILRELASRGELTRALMVVPAGLVENWRHELNDVFNLDFEVFGSEGDVSDRKTNAFARHNRLIASVDTLKRPARIRRLLEAPPWDLVVFDEAHHLSAYKNGGSPRKTENYKLAEALKEHCRDLLLLSATPHQGDHFRFWMLVRLLDQTLFEDESDMLDNRHRLNAVVVRRTKADSCAADGSPLFARRTVHTEAFSLSQDEKLFYEALLAYLRDGYNLAKLQGGKNRALGFVMTIFQKIAASSFAAVRSTLRRRLLMLTVQESIERDELLDVDGRDQAMDEARLILMEMRELGDDPIGRAQVEQLLLDLKLQLLTRRQEASAYFERAESLDDSEMAAASGEESAAALVAVALPEERRRIGALLASFPEGTESKTGVLLDALTQLWAISPQEKVVVFTTYLGSIDILKASIEAAFPGCGVEVLKGGDQGAKTAAQRRFKRHDGPRVLLTTSAGREGINLQFARVLFNHDLPWNPMDLEQRIGRIHRYGQKYTAQVYNLVAADTIEGKVYLLLEEKLREIAVTLGKVDELGQVTEDLRAQVLGQLSSRLNYNSLYQEAIGDSSMQRTRQEIEVAMGNASLAREVVFHLFQDLEGFNLGDYRQYDDQGRGMQRLVAFTRRAADADGGEFRHEGPDLFLLHRPGQPAIRFTTDRDHAMRVDDVELLGLEHPVIRQWTDRYSALSPEERGVVGHLEGVGGHGLITLWQVSIHGHGGRVQQRVVRLGIGPSGERSASLEHAAEQLLKVCTASDGIPFDRTALSRLLSEAAPRLLHRELEYSGALGDGASYSAQLLACVVLV